ncbi:MAG: hypothetical protein PHH26_04820 [Candidatus Thermoplasmatota archaeon]|nr:hypothetical protein [Candidatus Thermoplasmatota archaeon]
MNKSILAITALAIVLPLFTGCNGTTGEITVAVGEKNFETVVVGIITPGYSGDVAIDVAYGGEVKYTKAAQTSDEVANVDIKYSDFCVGNGQYTFKVSAGGEEGSGTYDVKKFVASVYVGVSNNTPDNNHITIELIPLPSTYSGSGSFDMMQISGSGTWSIEYPAGTTVKSGAWSLDGTTLSRLTIPVEKNFAAGSGQYTVRASFDNYCAKSNMGIREDPNSNNHITI